MTEKYQLYDPEAGVFVRVNITFGLTNDSSSVSLPGADIIDSEDGSQPMSLHDHIEIMMGYIDFTEDIAREEAVEILENLYLVPFNDDEPEFSTAMPVKDFYDLSAQYVIYSNRSVLGKNSNGMRMGQTASMSSRVGTGKSKVAEFFNAASKWIEY